MFLELKNGLGLSKSKSIKAAEGNSISRRSSFPQKFEKSKKINPSPDWCVADKNDCDGRCVADNFWQSAAAYTVATALRCSTFRRIGKISNIRQILNSHHYLQHFLFIGRQNLSVEFRHFGRLIHHRKIGKFHCAENYQVGI